LKDKAGAHPGHTEVSAVQMTWRFIFKL